MKRKLDAYKGLLAPQAIADGINAANANAGRLATDAKRLLEAGSFPTAASLAILAIEEAGKVSILRQLALCKSDEDAVDAWKQYRSHTQKNYAWILPNLAAKGARKLEDLRPLFDEQSDHPYVLDMLKQLGFYTDCLGQTANWAQPSDVITKELAEFLVQTAGILARDKRCSVREIELWIEHVGPVWKQNMGWMQQAVINWYAAMQAEGLAADGKNEMERFIKTGLPNAVEPCYPNDSTSESVPETQPAPPRP
jgi:AbiV family abortive infection protein